MKQLKIEAGKFYKTRDGRKAEVFCADMADREWPIAGRVTNQDGSQMLHAWTRGGKYNYSHDSACDLVSEWEEPVYRPYNWEEAQRVVGKVIKGRHGIVLMIVGAMNDGSRIKLILADSCCMMVDYVLKNYTFLDGSPCGVKEESSLVFTCAKGEITNFTCKEG